MIIYLADDRNDLIWKQFLKMGFRSKKFDGYVLMKSARLFFDCDDLQVTEGLNAQLFLEYLNSRDPLTVMVDDYVMPARLHLLLSGLHHSLGYPLKAAQGWKKWAEHLLRIHNIDPYKQLPVIDSDLEKKVNFKLFESAELVTKKLGGCWFVKLICGSTYGCVYLIKKKQHVGFLVLNLFDGVSHKYLLIASIRKS
ncbi:hypothetical protein RFI_27858 [Reticulomyxa filosa]|uniref:Uncharacterized protein n=1 Tax=Reticulomyxa filosa TaxID=46433 RepID=X6M919_RETFI|nr:hypothetical protein RFI_27858 [Reticulomyxa filosa]|eukprot:ETO09520.1 hypothetical protein RFI_27858 [Reticulomyxa filosa]